ncbi:MAG: SurA N-terminal domain-containing protein [Elusimicrobiaceae bacterium]|nr:SurA N-terminal domain-containing protein [Elusimicrobiaceae bacterium]
MISFLIKYKKSVLIITLAFFIASIGYLGLNSFNFRSLSSNAAMVGSTPITYRDLRRATDAQARVLRNNGVDVDENMTRYLTQQALSGLISEEVLNQAAQEFGMAVSDYEIAANIQASPVFNQNGQFNQQAYEHAVKYQLGVTPGQFEEQLRRSKLADRFRMALYSVYKLTPEEIKFSYQIQNGNLKDFDTNKADFETQLFETKMETAQRAFFDDFNNRVEIKTYLKDEQA